MRALALAAPLVAVAAAAWRTRPDRRTAGAALLALIAAAVGVAALNTVAARFDGWSYARVGGSALGVPVDLWLGWALLWGPLFVLIRVPLPATLLALAGLDGLTVPRMAPLVRLGPQWLLVDAAGLLLVAAPGIMVGRWCADRRRLRARVALQLLVFCGLLGWLLPSIAVDQGDGSWAPVLALGGWRLSLVVQLAGVCALPGLLALREFVERGGGSPYPWDPPDRFVTTGPYAYVANPMQCSGVLLMALTAALLRSWTLAGGVVVAVAFSVAVAGPHEDDDLARRHGAAWAGYRREVRVWRPRWRPYLASTARLHAAATCDVCSSTASALALLGPAGLRLCPAEDSREPLRRARYEGADGYHADGVAAVARGLEHVNLAWAGVSWILRIPLIDRLVQLVVDGIGGAPRALNGGSTWPTRDRS